MHRYCWDLEYAKLLVLLSVRGRDMHPMRALVRYKSMCM